MLSTIRVWSAVVLAGLNVAVIPVGAVGIDSATALAKPVTRAMSTARLSRAPAGIEIVCGMSTSVYCGEGVPTTVPASVELPQALAAPAIANNSRYLTDCLIVLGLHHVAGSMTTRRPARVRGEEGGGGRQGGGEGRQTRGGAVRGDMWA